MPELPAASPRHLIHGAAAAFTTAAGVPTGFKFTYGTWNSSDDGSAGIFGVIVSYNVEPVGDASNLKEGGGSTMAHAIIDPGWKISASVMVYKQAAGVPCAPPRMGVVTFLDKIEPNGGGTFPTVKAVVMSAKVAWEREGWTMLTIEAEARDSMQLGDTFGVSVDEASLVEAVIYTDA